MRDDTKQVKGQNMIKNTCMCAPAVGGSPLLTSSAVAQANPATALTAIHRFCPPYEALTMGIMGPMAVEELAPSRREIP
jgi:hypothetical protein